jgi:hypothetical protein
MRRGFALALTAAATALGAMAWAGPLATSASAAPATAAPAGGPSVAGRVWYPGPHYPELALPDGTKRTVRSLLDVRRPMAFGDWAWDETGVPAGPLWIRVDLNAQLISVFRGQHEIGSAVILYGARAKPSPLGVFHIMQKSKDYRSYTYDAPMPFMLRLTSDGVAIHASDVRDGWATHGCIGVPMGFATRLFGEAHLGDETVIVGPERFTAK